MRFKTVKELLDWIIAFHDHLATLYHDMAKGREQERIGLLLEYLADHQEGLRDRLMDYESDVNRLLPTWYEQAPETPLPGDPAALEEFLALKETHEVVLLAIGFHDQLIHLYQWLRDKAPNDSLRRLFESLADMESHEKIRMVRDALRLEDY